jgi:MarR family transcriptional regulator, transcriptional regulator for hemolysin
MAVLEHELDAPLWKRVEATLMATSRSLRHVYDARLAHLNLNLNEASLLANLDEHGPLSQRQLADTISIGRAAAGVIVGNLESRGLIERRPNPHDGRAVLVATTTAGHAMAEKILAVDVTLRAELRAGLTHDERAKLAELLSRLQTNIAAGLERTTW